MKRVISLLIVCFLMSSCANPSYLKINRQFENSNWKRIVVLPFSGDIRFRDEMTDVFAMQLLDQEKYEILEPSAIQDVIKKVVIETGDDVISIGDAQRIGQLVGVQAVFMGNVNAHRTAGAMNGFATVKLIDVDTGKIVVAAHKPSGLLMAWSEHQCVMKAVERAAKDLVKYLKEN